LGDRVTGFQQDGALSPKTLLQRIGLLAIGSLTSLALFSTALAQTKLLEKANHLELDGHFKQAAATLSQALYKPLIPADRKQLEFELDRLERIKKDFPYTQDQLFADLKKAVKNLTATEYSGWLSEGRFDSREIDGQRFFMSESVPNLFFRYPELNPRRLPPKNTATVQEHHWETCATIKAAAQAEQKPYVLPKRFRIAMTVSAAADAALPGELVRAWLPIPRQYPFQDGFDLLTTSPAVKSIDNPQSTARCIYLEDTAKRSRPIRFKIEYEYTTHGVWFNLDPQRIVAADPSDPQIQPFVREAPHIRFTPEMRALSSQIAGHETNTCLKAKKFYDWIADHIKYSYAIEYSTIRDIGEYCRSHGYGDCGQEALLFMTLCRLNNIPARWQSGWNTFPGAKSIHDWTEIYLPPYGWVPVDPYMGIYAMRYATSLTLEQQKELRDFYFGGLDQYRMAANSDHNQVLSPPKESMRSDNVDFQRGELEWGNHNIYFDQFSYELTVKEVKLPRPRID
jgi:transglutaminase-like putative cysteine protease